MTTIAVFLAGMATMGFVVAALFFFRFWRRTGEKLFLAFGIAFSLLALNETVVALPQIPPASLGWAYALRIMAFGLLITGIIAKNFGAGKPGDR